MKKILVAFASSPTHKAQAPSCGCSLVCRAGTHRYWEGELINYFSLYFCRQSGARTPTHLQPDWPVWHFDPVRATGCPHSCNADRPYCVVPGKFGVDHFPVQLHENHAVVLFPCWILHLRLSTGQKSHHADVVPHQVFQLVASHRHRSHFAHFHQHAGDICSQHFGHLWHHWLVQRPWVINSSFFHVNTTREISKTQHCVQWCNWNFIW